MYSRHEHKLGWDESKVGKVYKALKKLIVNCEVPPVRDSMLSQSATS